LIFNNKKANKQIKDTILIKLTARGSIQYLKFDFKSGALHVQLMVFRHDCGI
jgi:hypothetical protein